MLYDSYEKTDTESFDNGAPFAFWDISMHTSPTYYPLSNPGKTLMKTLGKALKISYGNR